MPAVLKAERHSVPLSIEYAAFEASAGAPETAVRVLLTTLQQCGGDDPVRFDLAHRACLLRAALSLTPVAPVLTRAPPPPPVEHTSLCD